jgi:hypothetical protein
MRLFTLALISVLLTACSHTDYKNKNITGAVVPIMFGQTLEKKSVEIPIFFDKPLTLLLVGYTQDTQFDIDRWLIALNMTETYVDTYELPAIQGMLPRMFKAKINDGMRRGIPEELWRGVITLYEDGETMQAFTGNENSNNARIILIDSNGKVLHFYDRGFSVDALNELRETILHIQDQ